jgi:hypothetical protein
VIRRPGDDRDRLAFCQPKVRAGVRTGITVAPINRRPVR